MQHKIQTRGVSSETEYVWTVKKKTFSLIFLPRCPHRHETGVEVRSEGPPDKWCLPPPLGNPHPILLSRWSVSWSVRFTIYILRYSLVGQYSLQLMIVDLTLLSLMASDLSSLLQFTICSLNLKTHIPVMHIHFHLTHHFLPHFALQTSGCS